MKLFVLAACAVVAVASAADPSCNCDATDAKSTLEHLKHALGEKAGLIAKWDADCKKETAETGEWLKTIEGNSAANLADFKAREADKGKLTEALETRIAGLKEFIAQLKDILAKLGFHIERTNKLYGTKYDANLQDQTAASLALHDLSLDFAAPHNVKLNPIQQVKDWSGDADASSTPDVDAKPAEPEAKAEPKKAAAKTEALMMFIEAQVQEKMSICKGPGCAGAYQKSFGLYKLGYKNNVQNKANFESERKTLGMFRKKTRAMLDKKAAKLKALTQQLEKLKAAMANPDGNLADLFPLVKEHATVFESSCKDFATSSASGKEALSALLQAIQAKKAEADKEDAKDAVEAPAATGAAEPEAPAAEPAKETTKAAPKADEDLTKILEAPGATGPQA